MLVFVSAAKSPYRGVRRNWTMTEVEPRLSVVLEALDRAYEGKLGDQQAHLDAPLVRAGDLGCAQHLQRLTQVQLGTGGLQGLER